MKKYDITVIGGGPGGYVAAIRAAQRGATVALVEKEYFGGTCLNWGCIPTKALIASAEVFQTITEAEEFGIDIDGTATPDWPAIMTRKDKIVETLRNGIGALLKSNKVKVYKGTAAFASRRQIRIADADGNEETIETNKTILATGSVSVRPGFIPKAKNILYSKEALASEKLPKDILVLGGGVIGCEFACMYARFGVKVTLVEMLPEILPMVDKDVARVVRKSMKQLGIDILTGTAMEDIKSSRGTITAKVGDIKLSASTMLVCIGRKAFTDGLNLEAAGLETNENGLIDVDEKCRTAVPGIYAIGDIAGIIQYAHRASAMGIVAANNATGESDAHSDALVPGCIFTKPEIGAVGLTEQQAKDDGYDVAVGKFPFAALGKAQIHGETDGFCKIVSDKTTDQVLGVHIVGPHATDLIAEAATAMNLEITVAELGRAMHAHPTLGEVSMEAAHAVHGECIHMPKQRH